MKLTPLKLVFSASLIILAVSACTQYPIKEAVPSAIPAATGVSYDHTQRKQINKQKYINQYQQAYIRTQSTIKNSVKKKPHNTATYRNQQATKRYIGHAEKYKQQAIRPAIRSARYNPAGQQANYQRVQYNKANHPANTQQNRLKQTWSQIHQGYQFGNYNNKAKVRRYIKSYARMPQQMTILSKRSEAYLPSIIAEVRRRQMPSEIALLPFVESAFKNKAYSHAHAAGLWQFIPGTARRYGLPVSKRYDARYDYKASTNAALSYLQDLNRQFDGDWLLSLAAYNCGEARVHREIAKNRKRGLPTDFWHLRLPKETRNYVPRLLAFKEIYSNPRAYGIDIAYIPSNPKFGRVNYTSSQQGKVTKKYRKYKKKNKKGTRTKKRRIITHRVKAGDTLFRIAKRYRTSVRKIMRINGLKSTKIKTGKRLKVATTHGRHYG